jgi:hypothetical protein
MKKSYLIQESALSNMPQISKKNENTIEFVAVLQEADRPNRNGRIYPKTVLEQALQAPYVQERLRTNSFYSEAGHPMDTSVQRQMTVDQKNIACLIKEFWWEGNLLKAKIETANTAIGRDMKGLIEQGSKVAFSLRAQGNVHHDPMLNATVVESPVQIATYDWVVNPSHDKAFLESICEETTCGLFGNKQLNNLVLAESISLFENGSLVALNEVQQPIVRDYAKNYHLKVKPLVEAYLYNKGDKLVKAEKIATIVNENVTKKVVLEDFLLKDIRHRLARLNEEESTDLGSVAAEAIATSDAEAKEDSLTSKNTELFPADEHDQVDDLESIEIKESTDLGSVAAEPIATSDKPAAEATPVVTNKDLFPADEHKQVEEVKEVIVEAKKLGSVAAKPVATSNKKSNSEKLTVTNVKLFPAKEHKQSQDLKGKVIKESELGSAAAEPIATSDKPAAEATPSVSNADVYPSEEHKQTEEVKEVIVEGKALVSGKKVTPEQAKAVKHVQVLDNQGKIVNVEKKDLTEIKNKKIVIKNHEHASAQGAKVRNALHETHHKDEHEPRSAEEIAIGTHPIHPEIKGEKISVEDHDLADEEGLEVRKELIIQEAKKMKPLKVKNSKLYPSNKHIQKQDLKAKVVTEGQNFKSLKVRRG